MADYDYYQKPKTKLFFDIETLPATENNREVVINLALKKESAKGIKVKKNKKGRQGS